MREGVSAAEILSTLHGAGIAVSGELPELAANEAAAEPCRHGEKPHASAPTYIHACHECRWKLATWRKDAPQDVTWRPARCHSWRHAGPCARAKASEDYARIKEALARHDRSHITYAVLTLDPSAWTSDGWDGQTSRPRREGAVRDRDAIGEAYKGLVDRWGILSKSMARKWGKFEYVATVEAHNSGWPHLNVVIVSHDLAEHVELEARRLQLWGRKSRGRETARRVFDGMLESAGFGRIAFIECALASSENGVDRLAAYIAKLAGEAGGVWDGTQRGLTAPADDAPAGAVVHSIEGHTVGEIAKLSQAPIIAPPHFRRIRSSKGFLPAKRRDDSITGTLFDEGGREIGGDPAARLLKAAILADSWSARDAVRRQASRLDDKYRIRTETGDDGYMRKVKQPKIVSGLDAVFDVLDKKDRNEYVKPLILVEEGPRTVLATMEGKTLRSSADIAEWLGDQARGPGINGPTRKWRPSAISYKADDA